MHSYKKSLLAAACLLANLSIAQAAPVLTVPTLTTVSDNFGTGLNGWVSAGNDAGNAVFNASGGNPGGDISVADVSEGWAYFSAPSAYRHTALADGKLSFDLMTTVDAGHSISGDVRMALVGKDAGGHEISFVAELANTRPGGTWAHYSFTFGALANSPFRVQDVSTLYDNSAPAPTMQQWADMLAGGLMELQIGADYSSANSSTSLGGFEASFLDNVNYQATFLPGDSNGDGGGTSGTVPEPGAASLALLALAALAFARCQRRDGRLPA